ncbi:PREDICTED: probable leucine-rich repeat receptor-like protein kinase At1g68400 [Nelumbo nucifera]|uniref:Probable leucine-rich repeat receptor-like protein kinase At1g68400 n=1 Tax=Nelumbo nucifera TaxID=4432 RepID=A0A1U8AQS8_NELNU|nr:PREDICTED: probable leucine-rich repeat receptor-like protein kinase At1g68400 [Nelumbo nucifera]
MAKPTLAFLHFVLCISLLRLPYAQASSNPDFQALMAFKTASDPSNRLSSWNQTADPCTWYGVSCVQNRVSRLVLEGLDIHGSFEPLTKLNQLRVLSLKRNRFSGSIPDLSNLTTLKLLFLSYNDFTGDFPSSVTSLFRLYRLDLSYNNLSGQIPVTINRLTHLLTLRLEENQFSGGISSLDIPNLQDFNVSGNRLTGAIPKSLSGFPEAAFSRNQVLCGSPLPSCKNIVSDPSRPGSEGAVASPLSPLDERPGVVSSSPSSKPEVLETTGNSHHGGTGKMSMLAVIAIILGDILVLALVSLVLYCYFWRNYAEKMREGKNSRLMEGEKIVYSSSPYPPQGGFERGKMVFFEGAKRFELEDLLRASAEMLGKGGFGTAYKAILDDGNVVAVKRLKEIQVGGKREFEQQMEILGRLRHQNVVSMKAYYYARDEKLLVYEYMPNGNLFWLLHGNRGPGRTPLDWTTRLRIAAGAARGFAYIHHFCRSPRISHGNIKSTNVLIDKAGNARVSDFGLSVIASPAAPPRTNGYRAPETSTDSRKCSQKADVYAFGVLLLELLTGKCPSVVDNGEMGVGCGVVVDLPRWVQSVVREEWTAEVFDLELMRYKDIEEEMVGLLQIAMACTSVSPEQRPKMGHVVKMIEEIRGVEEGSPSHDSFDSVSESPSMSMSDDKATSR